MHPPRFAPADLSEARGWRIWAGYSLLFVVLTLLHPGPRGVTAVYWSTAATWWAANGDIYTPGIKGYLYLPQGLLVLSPFAFLPWPLDQILWRFLGLALLACGIRRVTRHACPKKDGPAFAWASVLVLACTFSATNSGQTNLHLIGLMLLAGADIMERRWGRAAALLWVGMAVKPIAIVMILLCAALRKEMRWKLALGAAVFAALPYLHWDWGYVTAQYGAAYDKLVRSSQPGEKVYANLVWLLQSGGLRVPETVRTAGQLGLALATLGCCWVGYRRGGLWQGTWLLTAFAACYLVLLNPRTETNSYVILVPFIAMAAAAFLFQSSDRRTFFFLAALSLGLGCDNYGRPFHELTRPWLKPLLAVLFTGWLLLRLRRMPARPLLGGSDTQPDTA